MNRMFRVKKKIIKLRGVEKMIRAYIKLNSIEEITEFHQVASKCNYDLRLENGSYLINPKSLMGMFSLKLNKVMTLVAKSDDKDEFKSNFAEFFNQ